MEEEIDLRQYVKVLLKYKFWIVGLTVLAAAVAFVLGLRRPVVYEAEASLAMLRVRSEMTLEPKFVTLSDEDVAPRTDLKSLRETLSALVESSSVALGVSQQLGEQHGKVAESTKNLQGKVTIGNNGNLITIRVRDQNPDLAAEIANAWAQQAETHINSIYGQPMQPMDELQVQSGDVWDRYETAQGNVEVFQAQNQISKLEREILYRQDLIVNFQTSLADYEAAIYSKALANNLQILSDYYAELVGIERTLVDARPLYGELQHSGSALATEWAKALAFIGIQNRAFSVGGEQIQVILSGEAPATDSQDLERLIEMMEEKAVDVRAAIVQQEQGLFEIEVKPALVASDNPLEQRIQALTKEMLALQSQLEAASARERELTQARDLAWETYQTVARKLAEAEVAVQVPGSEVRLATRALEPGRPVAQGRLMSTAIAGMLGAMVSAFGAFALEWWRQEPSVNEEIEAVAEKVQANQLDN